MWLVRSVNCWLDILDTVYNIMYVMQLLCAVYKSCIWWMQLAGTKGYFTFTASHLHACVLQSSACSPMAMPQRRLPNSRQQRRPCGTISSLDW